MNNCCDGDDEDYLDFAGGAMSEITQTYGILDGGATSACGSCEIVQVVSDEWEALGQQTELEDFGGKQFFFGG